MDGAGGLPIWVLVTGLGIGFAIVGGLFTWRRARLDGVADIRRRQHFIVGFTLMLLGFGAFDLSWALGLAFVVAGIAYVYLGGHGRAGQQLP